MNKIAFFLSGLIGIIGLLIILVTEIIQSVMPFLGRVAFQTAASGSYTPADYYIDFSILQYFSFFLIILSIIVSILCYRADKSKNDTDQ